VTEALPVLGEAWCAREVALASGAEPILRDVTVELQLTGAPTGLGRVGLTVEGGRLVGCAAGAQKGSAVTLKLRWEDAVAVLRGELDPNAAFMTGAIKTDGPTGPLLALLASWNRPAVHAARSALADQTDFTTPV
jgi:hypothetical protein